MKKSNDDIISEKVRNEAIKNASDIQSRLSKKYPNTYQAKKYFHYKEPEHYTKIGETVYIGFEETMDWKQYGGWSKFIKQNEIDNIKEIMGNYKFEALQFYVNKKGSEVKVLFCFTKDYINKKRTSELD